VIVAWKERKRGVLHDEKKALFRLSQRKERDEEYTRTEKEDEGGEAKTRTVAKETLEGTE